MRLAYNLMVRLHGVQKFKNSKKGSCILLDSLPLIYYFCNVSDEGHPPGEGLLADVLQ